MYKRQDSLYGTFAPGWPAARKDTLKYRFISRLLAGAHPLRPAQNRPQRVQDLPNNAFFVGFLTYNARHDAFGQVFKTTYKSNLRAFLQAFQQRYGQP